MLNPKVTIIVLNYNGARFLPDCMDSIRKVTYPDFEVILADNNSGDGSADWFRSHNQDERFRILELSTNLHFAGGNNAAAKLATGEYLFFLNNDVRVKQDFIQNALKEMLADNSIGICQSNLVDYSLPDGYEEQGEPREVLYAQGAALLISKRVFDLVGGFDESFNTYVEDVDLAVRTRLMGYKVMLVPGSVVFHIGNATGEKLNGYGVKNQARNFPMLMIKNLQLRNLIVAMPLVTLGATHRMFKCIIEGKHEVAKYRIAGMGEFMKQLSSTFDKRRTVQKGRTRDDSAILQFTSLIDLAVKFRL